MTYCVGIKLKAGLVFLSDSRPNAGVDAVNTFRKLMVYEKPGERFMVLLPAGNLSIAQSVREILQTEVLRDEHAPDAAHGITIWNARSMFDAARVLGSAVRHVHRHEGHALKAAEVDFNVSLVFGGQIKEIKGEDMRLFQVYSAGNFIEAAQETPFFQLGESKYGKPVLDRVIRPDTPPDEAAKCALVLMDSTLKSNLSVGLLLDLCMYGADALQSQRLVRIDHDNPYYRMIHEQWGMKLSAVFGSLDDPMWNGGSTATPILPGNPAYPPIRKIQSPEERLI